MIHYILTVKMLGSPLYYATKLYKGRISETCNKIQDALVISEYFLKDLDKDKLIKSDYLPDNTIIELKEVRILGLQLEN